MNLGKTITMSANNAEYSNVRMLNWNKWSLSLIMVYSLQAIGYKFNNFKGSIDFSVFLMLFYTILLMRIFRFYALNAQCTASDLSFPFFLFSALCTVFSIQWSMHCLNQKLLLKTQICYRPTLPTLIIILDSR